MLALDHVQCVICLPVYRRDLENLYDHATSLYNQFADGHILLSRRQLATFPTLQ